MKTTTEAVSSNPVLIIDTAPNAEYIPHKDNFEMLENRINYLYAYLLERESYINSLVDLDRFDYEICDEFEDISTMFHKASMSLCQIMQAKNQLKNALSTNEEN